MSRLRAYLELGKLRLSALAVFAVIAGLYLGSPQEPDLKVVVAATVGTMLVAIAGNALNMFIERRQDRRMRRTVGRPLPTGRLTPEQVLGFGIANVVVGLALLAVETNLLATAICATIFVTYVLVYTPLKRVTTANTLVGAVPGALPPLVGYAAGAGHLDRHAMVLFLILFLWQIPHFLAIAWRYREDYRAGGMVMLPVVDVDGARTALQMVVYCLALVIATLIAFTIGVAGPIYAIAALALGIVFLAATVIAAVKRTDAAMRLCFLTSIVYLPLLFGIMVLDRPHPS